MFKKLRISTLAQFITAMFLVLIIAITVPGIVHYKEKSKELNVEAIQKTVQKYVVQCYAAEGSYPADLYYLEDNYGLILDEQQYIYDYEIFASNVMPEIKVFIK